MGEATAAILGAAFTAFAVWLAVRIINRREKWAKRTALALSLPVCYALSIGPAAFALTHGLLSRSYYDTFYAPLWWLGGMSETWLKLLYGYALIWAWGG